MYFVLPDFFNNYKINKFFYMLQLRNIEYFKNPSIQFCMEKGTFPYNIWNGGENSNYGDGCFYQDFLNFAKDVQRPVCFDISNVLLEDSDFYFPMMNVILNIFENSGNLLEITNLKLYSYIKEKYPKFKFIFSNKGNILFKYNEDILNHFLQDEKFNFVVLPIELNKDFDFLKKLKNRNKLILNINNPCLNCKNYEKCIIAENQSQLNYSIQTTKFCKKKLDYNNNPNCISIEEIEKSYIPLGINHFEISNSYTDNKDYTDFLIEYFIKDEYKLKVLKQIEIGEKIIL